MREIPVRRITDTVAKLIEEAAYRLPGDMLASLRAASDAEEEGPASAVLDTILENARVASEGVYPLCQDCGMTIVFIDVGQDVRLVGGDLADSVDEGVRRAYRDAYLRCSIVDDPLYDRKNTGDNTPAKIHCRIVPGTHVRVAVSLKGFGSENMSALAMLPPAAGEQGVIDFVVDTVRRAGPNPCPPVVLGIGIGSDFEGVAELAKRALLRPVGESNPAPRYAALEERLLAEVNSLGIGAAGYGGTITALGVNVEQAPTHIAGLPVAVNICCHSNRHASGVL
ncbi:MAG: fumarate hydratase [Synergistaceae bacterium]|nr:fumarate hydratase [Synergistota bacterium]NLM71339.1 fumarate hydratase [Synergistaceae bacterium]